ncbi:MAG: peptidylprolyl isomerase [Alphaproteobacteria bacterium]|nr:peptidylprolyl isomerase [Alphaproteobacteria bacterium]
MRFTRTFIIAAAFLVAAFAPAAAQSAKGADLENTLYLDVEYGRVVIEMRPDLAPNHVARIKELVREGFYDGIVFHRVIDGFMAQTGDPTGTGSGGSGKNLDAEFSLEKHVRGVVSMARAQNPNSADSQFFIVFDDAPWLDNQYTAWGKVTEGMEHIDAIKKGEGQGGAVSNPDAIVKIQVAADVKE